MKKTAAEIAGALGGTVEGNPNETVSSLNAFELAGPGDLTFAGSRKYLEMLDQTKASCVLVTQDFEGSSDKTLIKVKSPKEAFVMILTAIHKPRRKKAGIDKTAIIDKSVKLGENVYVGANVVINEGVVIGDDTHIYAGCCIGEDTKIGNNTTIYPNVTIYHEIKIGSNVIINAGTVIGADGFGFYEKDDVQHKIPQTGDVVIEDAVELGANDTVDRATFGSTIIGQGTKIDDMVHIAHNVVLGKNVIICGQSGIAGSTFVEDNVIIGAQAGVRDHIRLGKRSVIGAKSAVKDPTKPGEYVVGVPAMEARTMAKHWAAQARLVKRAKTLVSIAKVEEAKERLEDELEEAEKRG